MSSLMTKEKTNYFSQDRPTPSVEEIVSHLKKVILHTDLLFPIAPITTYLQIMRQYLNKNKDTKESQEIMQLYIPLEISLRLLHEEAKVDSGEAAAKQEEFIR